MESVDASLPSAEYATQKCREPDKYGTRGPNYPAVLTAVQYGPRRRSHHLVLGVDGSSLNHEEASLAKAEYQRQECLDARCLATQVVCLYT